MGAPARTWFCKNGHVVEDYGHHEMGPENEGRNPCRFCDETEVRCVIEWEDEDYWEDGKPIVPIKEIGVVEKTITVKIPVFDVSKLFAQKRE